jgi:hypothetical protein
MHGCGSVIVKQALERYKKYLLEQGNENLYSLEIRYIDEMLEQLAAYMPNKKGR